MGTKQGKGNAHHPCHADRLERLEQASKSIEYSEAPADFVGPIALAFSLPLPMILVAGGLPLDFIVLRDPAARRQGVTLSDCPGVFYMLSHIGGGLVCFTRLLFLK